MGVGCTVEFPTAPLKCNTHSGSTLHLTRALPGGGCTQSAEKKEDRDEVTFHEVGGESGVAAAAGAQAKPSTTKTEIHPKPKRSASELDLKIQLARDSNADLALLLRGKPTISEAELIECFAWSTPHSSEAVVYLHELLHDGALDAARRLLLLRWCTGLNALPVSGLSHKITLALAEEAADTSSDGRRPQAHTCYNELRLPRYSSKAVLSARLNEALDSFVADPSFGQE